MTSRRRCPMMSSMSFSRNAASYFPRPRLRSFRQHEQYLGPRVRRADRLSRHRRLCLDHRQSQQQHDANIRAMSARRLPPQLSGLGPRVRKADVRASQIMLHDTPRDRVIRFGEDRNADNCRLKTDCKFFSYSKSNFASLGGEFFFGQKVRNPRTLDRWNVLGMGPPRTQEIAMSVPRTDPLARRPVRYFIAVRACRNGLPRKSVRGGPLERSTEHRRYRDRSSGTPQSHPWA